MVDSLYLNPMYINSMSFNPYTPMSFGSSAMSIPFGGMDYMNCFNNDFMSTMFLFDSFLKNQMPMNIQNQIFTNQYNTKTNLASLTDVYNPDLGNNLANIAEKNANAQNTKGLCFKGVRTTLEKAGLSEGEIRGASAYQAADMLANHKNFREVDVSKNELKELPAGCIIVWDRNYVGTKKGDIHGHIAVTLGDGKEASDHVSNKLVMKSTNHRVFVPVATGKDLVA